MQASTMSTNQILTASVIASKTIPKSTSTTKYAEAMGRIVGTTKFLLQKNMRDTPEDQTEFSRFHDTFRGLAVVKTSGCCKPSEGKLGKAFDNNIDAGFKAAEFKANLELLSGTA